MKKRPIIYLSIIFFISCIVCLTLCLYIERVSKVFAYDFGEDCPTSIIYSSGILCGDCEILYGQYSDYSFNVSLNMDNPNCFEIDKILWSIDGGEVEYTCTKATNCKFNINQDRITELYEEGQNHTVEYTIFYDAISPSYSCGDGCYSETASKGFTIEISEHVDFFGEIGCYNPDQAGNPYACSLNPNQGLDLIVSSNPDLQHLLTSVTVVFSIPEKGWYETAVYGSGFYDVHLDSSDFELEAGTYNVEVNISYYFEGSYGQYTDEQQITVYPSDLYTIFFSYLPSNVVEEGQIITIHPSVVDGAIMSNLQWDNPIKNCPSQCSLDIDTTGFSEGNHSVTLFSDITISGATKNVKGIATFEVGDYTNTYGGERATAGFVCSLYEDGPWHACENLEGIEERTIVWLCDDQLCAQDAADNDGDSSLVNEYSKPSMSYPDITYRTWFRNDIPFMSGGTGSLYFKKKLPLRALFPYTDVVLIVNRGEAFKGHRIGATSIEEGEIISPSWKEINPADW